MHAWHNTEQVNSITAAFLFNAISVITMRRRAYNWVYKAVNAFDDTVLVCNTVPLVGHQKINSNWTHYKTNYGNKWEESLSYYDNDYAPGITGSLCVRLFYVKMCIKWEWNWLRLWADNSMKKDRWDIVDDLASSPNKGSKNDYVLVVNSSS